MLKEKKIKILGAGISGLVAANTLARNGFEVEVFEKRSRIGSFFEKDIHSLRNYCYDYDVIEKYRNLGVEIPYIYPIFREFRFSPSLKRIEIYSKKKPLFYNFIRGYKDKRSLDVELCKTAKKLGVNIFFNKTLNSDKANIISTGFSSIEGTGYGRHYSNVQETVPNSLYVFLNNNYSPNGYSYILPFHNEASVVIVSTKKQTKEKLKKNFNNLIRNNLIVKEFLKRAKFENEIFGYASYDLPATAVKKNKLYAGEAAGFLDAAMGFGTHYAILSGYLSATAIIDNKNYDNLWKKTFEKELRSQYAKRIKLENIENSDYNHIIDNLIKNYGDKILVDIYMNLKSN